MDRSEGIGVLVRRLFLIMLLTVATATLSGCAMFQRSAPLQVTVLGVEPAESQGMELRLLVKLRVQNPNDAAVDYNGVAVEMSVQGKTFATGVSDAAGSVPRFGEAVITVPVSASAFSLLGRALDMVHGAGSGKITYELKGKLSNPGFSSTPFHAQGEFALPGS
jgi:LEA14-like dessication related protein